MMSATGLKNERIFPPFEEFWDEWVVDYGI